LHVNTGDKFKRVKCHLWSIISVKKRFNF